MAELAIKGGKPVREKPFPRYDVIGSEEKREVSRVLDSGVLSRFLGCWGEDFYGGPEVREFEKEWARYFGAKHAIAVNSCTSGLYCAVGASGAGPGDEVIVSPYTMSASATCALIFNSVPVFADVESDYFCISPESVEKRITKRTKAIVAVDIFGQPYDAKAINEVAEKHGLLVIEDAAQAPYARQGARFAGTLGDIGVYSLNYHKHIHTGEGGVVVTDDDELAEKVRLIRNHAEAVVEDKGVSDLVNMVGFNFRLNEVEAAMGRCQLRKLKGLVERRVKNAEYLSKGIGDLGGIAAPSVRHGCTHDYYVQAFKYDEAATGVPRNKFIAAVKAELPVTEGRETEGVQVETGYAKPLYLQPMFQKLVAYGDKGCPFKCPWYAGKTDYRKGLCPTAERLYEKELFLVDLSQPQMGKADLDDVISAFRKVYEARKELE